MPVSPDRFQQSEISEKRLIRMGLTPEEARMRVLLMRNLLGEVADGSSGEFEPDEPNTIKDYFKQGSSSTTY